MAQFLKNGALRSDLASLQAMIATLSSDDFLGRMSLESREQEVREELGRIQGEPDTLASIALYFGGKPVIGSQGIETAFATTALSDFKDIVVMSWASEDTELAARGPVRDQEAAKLHVTELLHGSMGFLIEEIEPKAVPLFPTPLKRATDEAARLVSGLASDSDNAFQLELDRLHPRVFSAVRRLYRDLHKAEANVRIVDSQQDVFIGRESIDRTYVRLEDSSIEEERIEEVGLLEGIIPNGGRFEFRSQAGVLREGDVAATLSEAYLKRLENEQAIGKRFRALMSRKDIRRFGRCSSKYTLLDLAELGD